MQWAAPLGHVVTLEHVSDGAGHCQPALPLADRVQRLHTASRGVHVLREHRVRIQAGVGLGGAPGHPSGHTCGQEGGGVQGGGGNRVRQRR